MTTTREITPRCMRRPKRLYVVDGPSGSWITTSKRSAQRIIARETLGFSELAHTYNVTAYDRRDA